jgi:hypothetical protein
MTEKTELTLPERAAVALGTPKYEQEIRDLVAKTVTITEVKNKDGRDQCHGAMMTLKNTRVGIEKAAKAAREDATAFSKAVIAEEKRLVALAEPEEARLQGLRDAWDAEREIERQAKLAAEKARIEVIRKRIAEMQAIPAMLVGKSSETIAAAIESLEAVQITLDDFAEFSGEAEMAKIGALAKLGEMLSAQVAHEAEAKRLQVEREQLARERAETAERERIAALARAEEDRKAREALERQRAELAEQERKAAATRAEQEAKDRAKRERIAEEQRVIQVRAATVMREQQEAHEARMAAERAEIKRQQDDIAAQKAEQDRVERERQEAIEAEARSKRKAEEAAARAEAERLERERQAEAERAALAAEVARLQALNFANDGLGMLEDVLQQIAQPIGQECCGRPGSECCGCPDPAYHDIESLSTELNKWRNEIIERRTEQKEAA